MSPEDSIASLDADLAEAGEPVTIGRVVSSVNQTVICQAFVRSYRLNDQELVAGINQDILLISISPTEIADAGWPGQVFSGTGEDPTLPRKGDSIIVRGRLRRIDTVDPMPVNGANTRFDMKVIG